MFVNIEAEFSLSFCVTFIFVDELKHIIGAETTRKGILRVFEMFQHTQLNKRMVYVFLERFLETLFPQNKFHELFNKLHSRSKQMQRYKQRLHCTQAPSLQKRWHFKPIKLVYVCPGLITWADSLGLQTHMLLFLHQSSSVTY